MGVICAARAGLITGTILAVVRVSGETAPLLFTALSSPYWLTGLFGPSGYFGGPTANLTKTIYDFCDVALQELAGTRLGRGAAHHRRRAGLNLLARLIFQRGKEW